MKRVLIALIRFYQKYISSGTSPCCRFSPSCSHYGIQAIERFGALKGSIMTVWRILRCNPFSVGGYDPVPDINEKKRKNNKYKYIKYKK